MSDLPFAFYDLMPTFCDIAGFKRTKDGGFKDSKHGRQTDLKARTDGFSILPTLIGKGHQRLHDHLYWEFHETDMLGVRRGDWKLVVKRGQPALYNLADDPHEDRDLSAEHPDIVRLLVQKIYEDHTDNPLFPVTLPAKPEE